MKLTTVVIFLCSMLLLLAYEGKASPVGDSKESKADKLKKYIEAAKEIDVETLKNNALTDLELLLDEGAKLIERLKAPK